MNGELNRIAARIVANQVKEKRPTWTIKPTGSNSDALSKKLRSGSLSWTSNTDNVKPELAAMARDADVDAIFVIRDTTGDNSPGRGVGLVVRALPGLEPTAILNAHVLLLLVDRDGNEITKRSGGNSRLKASSLRLTGDLSSLDSPATLNLVKQVLQSNLQVFLERAATNMGY